MLMKCFNDKNNEMLHSLTMTHKNSKLRAASRGKEHHETLKNIAENALMENIKFKKEKMQRFQEVKCRKPILLD